MIRRHEKPSHACCAASGACVTLPKLPGTLSSEALDINDSGVVVGSAEIRTSRSTIDTVAVVWRGGTATALPGLPAPAGQAFSRAEHVNETGLVGGRSGGTTSEVVIWEDGAVVQVAPGRSAGFLDLGITDVNDAGEVVGTLRDTGSTAEQKARGFRWRDDSLVSLAPSFPLPSSSVAGITDGGLIFGQSYSASSFPGSVNIARATTWQVRR